MKALYIQAAGAVTALGHDLERTVASLRSGLDAFKEIPFWGATGEDLQAAPISGYAEGIAGIDRYEALVLRAIHPCFADLSETDRRGIGVLVGLPAMERPGVPEELGRILQQRLAGRLNLRLTQFHVVERGRTSVITALAKARQSLEANSVTACIVGGVDTLVNAASLRAFSTAGELKEAWDGFIPGEAAAFLRVSLHETDGAWGGSTSAITGIGIAPEPADGTKANPLVGKGLNQAFRMALGEAGRTDADVSLYLNDVNGSRSSFEDAAMGQVRFFRTPREHLETWHVASYLGETGAAVGALEIIWAAAALELGFAPGAGVLLSTSDSGLRTAAFMQQVRSGRKTRLQVGGGEPALHDPISDRPPVVDEDPGMRIADLDDLDRRLSWQNLQEASWLWSVREHHHYRSPDPWADIEGFERRLITQLDALVWAGASARHLAIASLMSEDLDESASAAMVLLSSPLDNTARNALLDAMLVSDERGRSIIGVMPYMPRQTVAPLLEWAVNSRRPELTVAALRAMAIGGSVSAQTVQSLVPDSPVSVVAELIHAAGAAALFDAFPPLYNRIKEDPRMIPVGVGRVALLNLASNTSFLGTVDVRQLVADSPLAAALMCLRDGISLVDIVRDSGHVSPVLLEALGWSGEQAAVPILLEALETEHGAAKRAAANALYRIHGTPCYEEVPDPDEDEGQQQGRLRKRLAQSRDTWESILKGRPRSAGRLRHGLPWSPTSAIHHLGRSEHNFTERLIASWEYAIVNRTSLPLYPTLFVTRQRELLASVANRQSS